MENEPNAIQNSTPPPFQYQIQSPLPNATAVLVLGILSIVTCFCAGIPGVVLAIIALVLASKDISKYNASPNQYTLASFNNIKAGKVCSIIGLCFSSLYLIYVVCVVIMAIISGSNDFDYYPGM
jgi:type III secretory pathway component EscU